MLHINKLSVPQQVKPHPYMKQIYHLLSTQESRQRSNSDGTLVQSFRSIQGTKYSKPGWIWFNLSYLQPSMTVAELILLRKTLHPEPLTVTVAVHSLSFRAGNLSISGPLTEHLLTLDQLPPSGYDVFNVTASLPNHVHGPHILGFQLRFRDESGSLVLHEALTQSLYCLNTSSLSQPLLVTYKVKPTERQISEHRQRQYCRESTHQINQHSQLRQQRSTNDTACKLYELLVDIHKSELGQWILQPTAFNISFCRGLCIKEQANLSLADQKPKDKHLENDKSPHCTSQETSPLTVMYRSATNDIIIKQLRDIRAQGCVCSDKIKSSTNE
ncbi:bone morphogenetic protein 2 [Ictalurus furcatus]|uniref:bone morphogenetic protein 2 n=1 Tax=Ictalurus furcatus TaxID=66913 RepID=UPI002350E081|nr:bone morphogenetic protein 2 [Ictalurus furcatus]